MNNKVLGIIIAIIVIAGGIYFINKAPKTPSSDNREGRVVFSITDAAVDMSTVSEINMTVNSIDMHAQGGAWITASTTARTYNLLDLDAKNESKVFADMSAAVGTYDMARLSVGKIIVKTKDGMSKEAKLPSGELRINTIIVVKENATASVNFDFMASKSLHMTGNAGYIFAPVVRTESKSDAQVTIDAAGVVNIGGGRLDASSVVGMDIDGSIKLNFELKADEKLDIINGIIKLHSLIDTKTQY
jgi:hypothetical protein